MEFEQDHPPGAVQCAFGDGKPVAYRVNIYVERQLPDSPTKTMTLQVLVCQDHWRSPVGALPADWPEGDWTIASFRRTKI